jgi:hypothetical protein
MSKKPVAVTLRKPQAPVDLDGFVAGESTPASAPAPTAGPRPIETPAEVQHGARNYREMTLYLPTEVARELSFYCMDRNCDLNRVVADAVSKHLSPDAPNSPANIPWRTAVESLVEQSRSKLSGILALRPWVAKG